jgi:hypothetical protein
MKIGSTIGLGLTTLAATIGTHATPVNALQTAESHLQRLVAPTEWIDGGACRAISHQGDVLANAPITLQMMLEQPEKAIKTCANFVNQYVGNNAQDGADLNGTSAEINWHTIPTTLTERNDYMKEWMNPGGQ